MCLTQACAAPGRASAARERRAPIHPHGDRVQEPSMCVRATSADFARLWERPYPGTTDQVQCVRAALREFLGSCPVADDAVHLLSELSANAIAYSDSGKRGGTFTVRAEHFPDSYVWGEVESQGITWDGNLSS